MGCLKGTLGTELQTSAGVVCDLNSWGSSPALSPIVSNELPAARAPNSHTSLWLLCCAVKRTENKDKEKEGSSHVWCAGDRSWGLGYSSDHTWRSKGFPGTTSSPASPAFPAGVLQTGDTGRQCRWQRSLPREPLEMVSKSIFLSLTFLSLAGNNSKTLRLKSPSSIPITEPFLQWSPGAWLFPPRYKILI